MSELTNPESNNKQSNQRYVRLVAALIAVWFLVSLSASALRVFEAGSKTAIFPPLPLGLAVVVPIVVFLSWLALSSQFREFALALNPRILTFAQSWRIGGFVFLILAARGILPAVFALPAGWGDIAVGATAPLAASYLINPRRRSGFLVWQMIGVFDLVMAVTLGVLTSATPIGRLAHGLTSDAMTVLPMSLVPTFFVPLLLIFHIICIAQAVRWPRQQTAGFEQQWRSAVG